MNEDIKVLDREQFERVWGRVMPQDRPDCPFTLEKPAEQRLRPIPGPPPPPAPGQRPEPALPPRPAPAPPSVCLGEESRDELPALEELLSRTARDAQAYQSFSRRWSHVSLFRECAKIKSRQLGKLRAAWYLISGKPWNVPALGRPTPTSLQQALRMRHRAEQETASALLHKAEISRDPCLVALYRTLAQENRALAHRMRERLEQ